MPTNHLNRVIEHLRDVVLSDNGAGMTDGQLLECFVSRRDRAAIGALVQRHGPMVWGGCRRILANHHDAEDAFQATFLVLVRKAAAVVPRALVANWLYGVARQTALKARATAAKKRGREKQVAVLPERAVVEPDLWKDLQPLVDRELSRLPGKYRAALVLCDLEGKTRHEAARELDVPEGTVASRLARGRALLAKRLARQGMAVSVATLAAAVAQKSAAGVPSALVSATIKVLTLVGAEQGTQLATGAVAALTEGVLKAMFISKLKKITAVLLVLGITAFGGGVLHHLAVGQETTVARDTTGLKHLGATARKQGSGNVVAEDKSKAAGVKNEAKPESPGCAARRMHSR